MSVIADTDVKRELSDLEQKPVNEDERKNACRAIMRFKGRRGGGGVEDDESPIEVTEDWVRLYVALRRASGSQTVRLNASHLRRWRQRVSQYTTVKRKVFIVQRALLECCAHIDEDLHRWVIPRGELDLPADIYEDDVLFIDDGYDRSKLNMPGVLHLEVGCKCARESFSGRPSGLSDDCASECESVGRSSGLGSGGTEIANSGIGAETSKQPAAAAAAEHAESTSLSTQPSSEPEKAMADIIAQTVKALGLGRWVSNDVSLPNTVEFWVRLFTNDMTKKPKEETKLTEPQKGFVKYITKSLFESDCGYSNLRFVVPHIVKMQQWSSEVVPPLATVLVKLSEVD